MHVVRLGASRVQGMGWKSYDEQFRYRMSLDPTNSWANIDNELWLLYMSDYQAVQQGKGFTPQFRQFKVAGSHQAFNKCYAFNFKGHCNRMQCSYKHVCIQCSAAYQVIACRFNHGRNHSFRSRHPNSSQFFFQFSELKPLLELGFQAEPKPELKLASCPDIWALGKSPINTDLVIYCLKEY